jgi:two-component system phosphate regulon sensor histidine kinase PhoR
MNRKIITGLIVLMGISILGIIAVQLVWLNHAIGVKNELFSRSVNEALNNTVNKLENIHHFTVMNRMVFTDSTRWKNHFDDLDFEWAPQPARVRPPDLVKIPPKPTRIIRRLAPGSKNKKVEIRLSSDSISRVETYAFSFETDTNRLKKQLQVLKGKNPVNHIFFEKPDSLMANIDSIFAIYSPGLIRIDSVLSQLDTFSVVSPEITHRVEVKAGRLRNMANRVATEIATWDVQNIDNTLINEILTEELKNQNIPIGFEFGILRDSTFLKNDTMVTDSLHLLQSEYKVNLYPNDIFQKNLKLAVYFPGRESFIYRSINWLLAASFLFSLIILVTFGLSIFFIIRQKKISEMKSDFINNMTHEFKTPIATISVATDSIVNEKVVNDPGRIRYFAGMIKKENTRMNRQVEDILTIARLDKKEFDFHWEPVDVHELIEDAVQSIILQVEKRGGMIETNLNAMNSVVITDKTHFSNVIYNLLDNANKYSPDKPEITVITVSKTNGVVISVEDKGIGMTRAVQGKIFERFYRQTSGNIHNVKGFGLGLSYAKAVVEANRGSISVQSEPGKGSKFDLFLPFVRV